MIDETGSFYEDPADQGELVVIRAQGEARLKALDTLKDIEIPQLEFPCIDCKGAKMMQYTIIKRPPRYLRIFGVKMIRKELPPEPCRRCKVPA